MRIWLRTGSGRCAVPAARKAVGSGAGTGAAGTTSALLRRAPGAGAAGAVAVVAKMHLKKMAQPKLLTAMQTQL